MSSPIGAVLFALLSSLFGGRFYPGRAPDSPTAPYAVYLHMTPTENTFQGATDFQNFRVQIDIWAGTYLEANTLADSVEAIMAQQVAYGSPSTFSSMEISRDFMPPDPDVRLHRLMLEFSLWYRA